MVRGLDTLTGGFGLLALETGLAWSDLRDPPPSARQLESGSRGIRNVMSRGWEGKPLDARTVMSRGWEEKPLEAQ